MAMHRNQCMGRRSRGLGEAAGGAMMSWRDHLPVHPAADLFPMLTDEELAALGEDIKRNGLASPIAVIVEDNKALLIDGRNRLDAMERVGLQVKIVRKSQTKYRWEVEAFDPHGEQVDLNLEFNHGTRSMAAAVNVILYDPVEYIASANIHRRHLTQETKRDLIAKLLQESPERSDRATAEIAKVDHKTVAAVRREQERVGSIPHVERVVDTKGRRQPTNKSKSIKPIPTTKPKSRPEVVTTPPTARVHPGPSSSGPVRAEQPFGSGSAERRFFSEAVRRLIVFRGGTGRRVFARRTA
ncbi:hypothetical protein XH92_19940 [Bradyrhizobium sp. CCBAU 53421]|nr:hypothetical protein XH92_19940 [Bradyrhizobium sp. CCBAU 53421]